MIHALATLLLALPAAAPAPAGSAAAPVIRHDASGPDKPPVTLATADDVMRLCRALEFSERVRSPGDAVERGEAETAHGAERAAALKERYAATVPAAKLPFAPYDGPERRLALHEPVQLPVADGTARLWPTEARSLAVEAEAGAARRVLDAQRRGTLALSVVFDLPEDATCASGPRGKTYAIPIDPVAWRWLDGEAVIAHGGAAAERPLVSAAQGARPRVDVGEPIAGPAALRKAVVARSRDLEGCYAEALKKDPALDGVLVADLGGPRAAISADSVGDVDFAACVQKALASLAPAQGGKAAVPIRFELAPPIEPVKAR
ncbi:MAG TPA: hypothetical protein VIW03_17465 [Anaeromyxobacter sp.]